MSDDFRERLNHPAVQRQKVAIELGKLSALHDRIAALESDITSLTRQNDALQAQVEAADALAEDIGQVLGLTESQDERKGWYDIDRYSIENMQKSYDTYRAASDEDK